MGHYYIAANITRKQFVFGGSLDHDIMKSGWFNQEEDPNVIALTHTLENEFWSPEDEIEYFVEGGYHAELEGFLDVSKSFDVYDHQSYTLAKLNKVQEMKGDLFEQKGFIVIPTNGVVKSNGEAVMGKGVALTAAKMYPNLPQYLGQEITRKGNNVHYMFAGVIAFPTKEHYKDNSTLELIEKSTAQLKAMADERKMSNIFLPRVGCGLGGLQWKQVKSILQKYLDGRFTVIDPNYQEVNPVNNDRCNICDNPEAQCVCYAIMGWPKEEVKVEETKAPEEDVRCVSKTKKGEPCKNKPMAGADRCGPHQTQWLKESGALNVADAVKAVMEDKRPTAADRVVRAAFVDAILAEPVTHGEYDLPDPDEHKSVTPANAGVKEETIVVIERAQAQDEPSLFIVAGTGSREVQNASAEGKGQLMAWLNARLLRLKEKYGDRLVIMSGMAEGFDKALANAAIHNDIKLWIALPSGDYGSYYWGRKSLTGRDMLPQFNAMLAKAWRVTEVMPSPKGSQKYNGKFGAANLDRNDFMVDQANAFLVYDPSSTGTAHCFAAIKKADKPFEIVPKVQ